MSPITGYPREKDPVQTPDPWSSDPKKSYPIPPHETYIYGTQVRFLPVLVGGNDDAYLCKAKTGFWWTL